MIAARFARLNSDGTTDSSFEVGANAEVFCVAVRDDGAALIGGDFSSVKGEPSTRLALVGADGEVDTSFALSANGTVRAAVAQADSKFIVGGSFTSIAGISRNRIARITAAGELELSFNPNADDIVHALGQQGDGKIMVGGEFANIGGGVRANYARLLNDSAVSTLTVQSSTTILWERAGTTPETQRATFDLSTDGGMSWTPLGEGTAVLGGWTLTGLTLSADGQIRARAYPPSSSSQGIVEEIVSFDFVPEIQVEQPEGTILVDATSTVDYGSLQVGSTSDLIFTIRNIGLADLVLTTPTQVALSGTNPGEWSILAQPATPVVPNGTSQFTVRFLPTSDGGKSAVLTILSDDADEGTFTISLSGTATPGPGSYDTSFQPVASDLVYAVALDALNKASVGGSFTSLNAATRNRFGRLLTDGTTDVSLTGTAANNQVTAVAVQADGSFLLGGSFTSFNGTARNRVVRINATGTVDGSFNPNANGPVTGIEVQADGKIILCGSFTSVGGVARPGICRIFSAGTVDVGFAPPSLGGAPILSTLTQADGKVLANNGSIIRRFTTSGAIEAYGNTGAGASIVGSAICMATQEDGKLLVGGSFTTISGTAKTNLARLDTDGTVDTSFTATLNGNVRGISVQTDGRILIVGDFTTISGNTHRRLGRLLSDGTEDTTFSSTIDAASGTVLGVALQEDGKPIITGDPNISGVGYRKIARFINDPASEELSVVDATEVQWLRSGSTPETTGVAFQYSQNGGTIWTSLGEGVRVTGGWGLTGISLPISGILRGLARVPSAYQTGSQSLLESRVNFSGLAVPDISVQQPTNTERAENSTVSFTGRLVGQTGTLTFTIVNTGNAVLSGLSVISTNAGEFAVTSLGATSLASGGSTTFDVQFSPSATGSRTSQLIISSNVPGTKNPYSFNLQGNGITTPLATTQSAQSITSSMATLRGSVTPRDDTSTITFQYRVGSGGAWTTVAAVPPSASGFTATSVTRSLTSLVNNTGYQFRVGIANSVTGPSTPVYGSILSFTTLP